jgi:hypothetical protein
MSGSAFGGRSGTERLIHPNEIRRLRLVLAAVTIIMTLSWGVYAVLWTFPNDTGGTINAVLGGELESTYCCGNGTVIPAGSEAQFIIDFGASLKAGNCGSCPLPNGLGFVTGPFGWTAPGWGVSSIQKYYAVFTYQFSYTVKEQLPAVIREWFSGPQGNLSESMHTDTYGGLNNLLGYFETSIFEATAPGNYTLHYFDTGSANFIGKVVMGASSVVFSRPYLYAGIATIVIATAFSGVTGFASRRKLESSPNSHSSD